MDITKAKKIMGKNFIGPVELGKIGSRLGVINPMKMKLKIPKINFDERRLRKIRKDYILILGMPKNKQGKDLTLNCMRNFFGFNPGKSEPCFYNQDWYLREKFADKINLKFQWYLVGKNVAEQTRGKNPHEIIKKLSSRESFPSAVLNAYTFFAYYFLNKKLLWKHDFIWCSDKDKNGDRIYTGRYADPQKINKNGFNIHRHLAIRSCYGAAMQILK